MNKVILMGGSHHNGLGLVRSFGVNGIAPYGIIIGSGAEKSFVRASKYWAKTWTAANEERAIELLLHEFGSENLKPVIIPWSDGAAEAVDLNLNKLKDKFIVPSINGKQGAIAELMDKQKQMELAKKYGLPMAKSAVIDLSNIEIRDDMIYPCILKPVVSVEGKKQDIRKVDKLSDLMPCLFELKEKGYSRILVQEWIDFEYEVSFIGSCSGKSAYLINKKVRLWPEVGGSNSFVCANRDQAVEAVCQNILGLLNCIGYQGMFDVELLCTNRRVLLNEINWRNSGNSFFSLGTEVHYAVVWYYTVIGKPLPKDMKLQNVDYLFCAMNESTDLRHVVYGKLPLRQWNADRKRAKSFALWFAPDLKPTLKQYWHLAVEFVRRRNQKA